jgi:hypothetical protein
MAVVLSTLTSALDQMKEKLAKQGYLFDFAARLGTLSH